MPDHPPNDPLDAATRVFEEGRFADALPLLRSAAGEQPENPRIYDLAGQCLLGLGDFRAALDAFRRATNVKADWPAPYLGAAKALTALGDAHAGMQTLLHVLDIAPGHLQATQQLIELLARLKPDRYLAALRPALRHCLAHPDVDPAPLGRLCGQQLRLQIIDEIEPGDAPLPEAVVLKMAQDPLWLDYLSRVINTDPYLEAFLTRLRRHLCLTTALSTTAVATLELIPALAQQYFLNEYLSISSDDELKKLAEIEAVLDKAPGASDTVATAFAIACLYRAPPLTTATLRLAEVLMSKYGWLQGLCRRSVIEPFAELKLAADIPSLHPVQDATSRLVKSQYEANPYPRWQAPPAPRETRLMPFFRSNFSRRAHQSNAEGSVRLLVAGCGTGFEPIDIARRDSSIFITAVDLSTTSLAYARRQALALGCDNIEFYQCDILDLPKSGWEFDIIICTGVLHHMADPIAGWKVLRELLADDGMMRVSLYSKRARHGVITAREHARRETPGAGDDDIRRFRQWALSRESGGQFADLVSSDDFYSMSGCRDLVFHVQEHQFTLPQIKAALDDLDLRFCGFEISDMSLLRRFQARYPAAGSLTDIRSWDHFERENSHAFAGMYQFWCEPE